MFAIEVTGHFTGIQTVLSPRYTSFDAADRMIDRLKEHGGNIAGNTRRVVTVVRTQVLNRTIETFV